MELCSLNLDPIPDIFLFSVFSVKLFLECLESFGVEMFDYFQFDITPTVRARVLTHFEPFKNAVPMESMFANRQLYHWCFFLIIRNTNAAKILFFWVFI